MLYGRPRDSPRSKYILESRVYMYIYFIYISFLYFINLDRIKLHFKTDLLTIRFTSLLPRLPSVYEPNGPISQEPLVMWIRLKAIQIQLTALSSKIGGLAKQNPIKWSTFGVRPSVLGMFITCLSIFITRNTCTQQPLARLPNLFSVMSVFPKALAEGRRPEGEGANIDRRLVPYHGKWKRVQSRIECIYIYIYIYIYMHQLRSFLRWRAKVGYWVDEIG